MTQYNIKTKYGNTFQGVQFTIQINGAIPTSPIQSLLMQIRKNIDSPPVLTLKDGSGLTIVNPTNAIIKINPQIFTIPPNDYQYDILIIFEDGTDKTYDLE